MKINKKLIVLPLIAGLFVTGCSTNKKENDSLDTTNNKKIELNVSAAASLKEAMAELEKKYEKENTNIDLVTNFGASGSLQKQIEQGAPCDVFISAGEKQMKSLDKEGLLLKDSYKNLVENELVLVSKKDSEINSMDDIKGDKVSHIAVGEPESVPAGKYAKETLESLKLADTLKDKLVYAKDVKEVLAWTQTGNAEAGFVYLSDTVGVDNIKIVENVKDDLHSAIIYPVGVIDATKQSKEAKDFENFLLSDDAQAILVKYGYKQVHSK